MRQKNFNSASAIANLLERVISTVEMQPQGFIPSNNRFCAVNSPSISIHDYLARIHNYCECSDSCYVFAFIYIDRLLQNNPSIFLCRKNVHRLILAAVLISIKFLDDLYGLNKFYAMVGGINLAELNFLECKMLELLNFELYVDPELFYQYSLNLELEYQIMLEEEFRKSEPMTDSQPNPLKPITTTESMGSLNTASLNIEV